MNVWLERRVALVELGFATYEAYLASDLWRRVRRAVLNRDRHRCRCGVKATQVHHRRYAKADLSGQTLRYLVAICEPCHRFGSKDGERVTTPDEAEARIAARLAAKGKRPRKKKLRAAKAVAHNKAKRKYSDAYQRPDGMWDVSGRFRT